MCETNKKTKVCIHCGGKSRSKVCGKCKCVKFFVKNGGSYSIFSLTRTLTSNHAFAPEQETAMIEKSVVA